MANVLRFRKQFDGAQPEPKWPAGAQLQSVETSHIARLRALLLEAYANGFGSVGPADTWWADVIADPEYDKDLVFVAVNRDDAPIGVALCWSSGFVKDVAVIDAWRGRGVGEALLRTAFEVFAARGMPHVDLKVIAENASAIRLYRRLGMVEAAL